MDIHSEEEDDLPTQGKRKGMIPLPSNSSSIQSMQGYSTIQYKKPRAQQSMQSLRSQRSVGNMRDVSVSTAMSMLHIDDEPKLSQKNEHQAISSTAKSPSRPGLDHKPFISTGVRNLRIDSTENALVLFQAPGDSLVAPKTPSQIPVLSKSEVVIATPATPCKTPKISPQKTPFLSKGSNITGFTAWDVRGRLEDMEAMYNDLQTKLSGTAVERNTLVEAVPILRARSMFCS